MLRVCRSIELEHNLRGPRSLHGCRVSHHRRLRETKAVLDADTFRADFAASAATAPREGASRAGQARQALRQAEEDLPEQVRVCHELESCLYNVMMLSPPLVPFRFCLHNVVLLWPTAHAAPCFDLKRKDMHIPHNILELI